MAIVERAHAKINLTLEVLGKRPDGYHNLASVMQTVDLYDTVAIEPSRSIEVFCDADGLSGDSNLCHAAAVTLARAANVREGARITVAKQVPVASGLGGGSSDAAAALRGLNRLWGLDLPFRDLASIGAGVGSDVPFLVYEGAALVRGRGDEVLQLPEASVGPLLLVCPEAAVENKTRRLFSRITPDDYTAGDLSHKLAGRIHGGGDVPAELTFNVFGRAAANEFAGLTQIQEALRSLGARDLMLTGAGPSFYARIPKKEIGTAWSLLMEGKAGCRAFVVNPWSPVPARKTGS